jgi:hypothetical protein
MYRPCNFICVLRAGEMAIFFRVFVAGFAGAEAFA